MAAIDDLREAYTNMAARLKEITATPKPTYTIDGQTVLWGQYQRLLLEQMKNLRAEIEAGDEETFLVNETQAYVNPPYGVADQP